MQNQQTRPEESTKQDLKKSDLVDLILEDHKALKKLIEVMKDPEKDIAERKSAFEVFAPTLVAHAKPEERVLYTTIKEDAELREQGFEGDVEHSVADQLVEECKRTEDQDLLGAQIKVLAELVEHHIEEEEEDLLPDFKKHFDIAERSQMGNDFLRMKVDYLAAGDDNIIPDPKTEQEEGLRH